MYEGVLEVLDPVSGRLLGSQVVGGDMIRFIAPAKLYQIIEDSTGVVTLQIWNARFKRP